MVTLKEILPGIDVLSLKGDVNTTVAGIEFDSRKAVPGTLFVAVKGTKTDGHNYIGDAVRSGASVVVCELLPEETEESVTWVKTSDSSMALGLLSSSFFGNPSSSLKLTGVTGTNGKTTIATLLYRLFRGLGYKCGLFSTICNYINDKEYPATHTTPDP
ncbi:MAG: UDP-N-acetylmuramoyl-L-alanyl-D-glutamate--2,6-diaminopimelate ligase, partial [Bacteroidales bacterium]|nr:UDP-N-acetylmuramoyl-L-alanyl-D-glutamate--2,6-diaminopimelate ligase [Bacteroidales bacterium]